MNMISQLRQRVTQYGLAKLTVEEFNQLQAEWIKRESAVEKMSLEQLDEEMKALGMMPVSAMINGNPIMAHSSITDMDKFEQWLNMRHKEMLKFKARMIVKGQEDNELYEWAIAYHAALAEVLTNFNQAKTA